MGPTLLLCGRNTRAFIKLHNNILKSHFIFIKHLRAFWNVCNEYKRNFYSGSVTESLIKTVASKDIFHVHEYWRAMELYRFCDRRHCLKVTSYSILLVITIITYIFPSNMTFVKCPSGNHFVKAILLFYFV